MAKLAGRPKGDLPELIDWLKTVPADRFADHSKLAPNTERTFAIANAPVVESKIIRIWRALKRHLRLQIYNWSNTKNVQIV